MSDHWEQFPCAMGEHTAFISYDHGVSTGLSELPFPFYVGFRAQLMDPDERGLPRGEEFQTLNQLEDFLCGRVADAGGVQVGRITTKGARYFLFYTSASEEACVVIAQEAAACHEYELGVLHEPDPERAHYWNELYPTEDDWQVIQDIRVQEALEREGDTLQEPREIQHWAYFPSGEQRRIFVTEVSVSFSGCEEYVVEDEGRGSFVAKLSHVGLPDYHSMNRFTILLARAARKNGGTYDGWETKVCRG